MIIQGQAVVIPQFGEFPNLVDGENFSAFEVVALTPFVNPFFRLEEKYGRSGECQVIVPAGEGQREVDPHFAQAAVLSGGDTTLSINLFIPNFQLNRLITLCANGFDDRVTL